MKKYVLIGAGNNGRNIIEMLPYGMIGSVMDSDDAKVGIIYESFVVEKLDFELLKNKKESVILSIYDEKMIEKLTEKEIEWYITWGRNKKNIFMDKYVSEILMSSYKDKYYRDKRLKREVDTEVEVSQFREKYCSLFNRELVELMKKFNENEISNKLNMYYSNIENNVGMFEDEYFDFRVGFQLAERIIREKVIEKRGVSDLLDIACGHGEFINKLRKNVKINVDGIDISKTRVKFLIDQGISASVGKGEKTGKEDNSYDFVTCFECLEHVVDPVKVIEEIYRILRPSGYVIISVPYKKRCECDTHVRIFDENSVSVLVEKKFEIENIILIPCVLGNALNSIFLVAKKEGNGL